MNWTYTGALVGAAVARADAKAARRAYFHCFDAAGVDPVVIPWASEVLREAVVDSYAAAS